MHIAGILFLLLLVIAAWWWWTHGRQRGGPDFKCRTCRHCRRLDRDGVMCGFGTKQVFKNPAQIDMCPDHTPR
jgi:hypothetical protein